MYVVGLIVSGLLVGALARLLVPGRQPIGCLGTIAAGLLDSIVAGLAGQAIFGDESYAPGFLASVLGAALVVWLLSRFLPGR